MLWNLLNTSITIKRKSVLTGPTGNQYVYTPTYTSVAANVQPLKDSLKLYVDGRKVSVDYQIYVCTSVIASPDDQVVWNGLTLRINYIQNLDNQGQVWMIHASQFTDGA